MGRGHRREGREGGRGSSQIRRRNGDDQVTLSKLSKTPARRGARVRRGYTRTTFGMHGGAAGCGRRWSPPLCRTPRRCPTAAERWGVGSIQFGSSGGLRGEKLLTTRWGRGRRRRGPCG